MNILFFSSDGKLGDAILHTSLVKGIKDSYPDANIYCMTAGSTTEFWRRDPRITESWPFWKLSFWQTIKLGLTLRKKKLDYMISWNPIKREKLKLLCWLAKPKYGVKIFTVNPDEHASIKEQRVLEMLKCPVTKVRYSIYESNAIQDNWDKEALYFNIFASVDARTVKTPIAIEILDAIAEKFPNKTVYMTYFKQTEKIISDIVTGTKNKHVIAVDCTDNLEKLISLCSAVSLVITPDTAIVHIASAFNKPIIALFEKGNMLLQTNWAPISDNYKIVDFFGADESEEQQLELVMACLCDYIPHFKTLEC